MLQAGGVAGLPHGTLPDVDLLLIGESRLSDDLFDGDRSFQSLVDRFPDNAHRPATDVFREAIVLCDQLTGVDDAYSCRNMVGVSLVIVTVKSPRSLDSRERWQAVSVSRGKVRRTVLEPSRSGT